MAHCAHQAVSGRPRALGRAWRSLKSADFAVALRSPVLATTPHFVLHHLAADPCLPARRARGPVVPDISTGSAPFQTYSVDNADRQGLWWLGLVVPKRHARRAVTRSLLKHQMRAQADVYRGRLPAGQWLIRLRAPFDMGRFKSAASAQLREAARSELELAFAGAVA